LIRNSIPDYPEDTTSTGTCGTGGTGGSSNRNGSLTSGAGDKQSHVKTEGGEDSTKDGEGSDAPFELALKQDKAQTPQDGYESDYQTAAEEQGDKVGEVAKGGRRIHYLGKTHDRHGVLKEKSE
jgi:hypothetical protein